MTAQESFLNGALPVSRMSSEFFARNKDSIISGKSVLDIGSGEGKVLQHCLELGADVALGIDLSADAVAQSQKEVPAAHFACADINDYSTVMDFINKEAGVCLDTIVCNASQIPLPKPLENGYFVGTDGRAMLDAVLKFAGNHLGKDSAMYLGQTELSNQEKTVAMARELGLQAELLTETTIKYPLYPEVNTEETRRHLKDILGFEGDTVSACMVKVTRAKPEASCTVS